MFLEYRFAQFKCQDVGVTHMFWNEQTKARLGISLKNEKTVLNKSEVLIKLM